MDSKKTQPKQLTSQQQKQPSTLQILLQQAQNDDQSLFRLLQIGRTQGFENFVNRKQIWPFLLKLDSKKLKQTPVYQWKGGMNRNSFDFQQLQKDAERSLSSMKTFQSITKFHLKKKQEAVLAVLDSFFAKNPQLKYIQGFHDVASVFLILFGNSTGYYLMQKAGRTYFYDFLTSQFGQLGQNLSEIVYQMVTTQDPDFKNIYTSYENTGFLIFILPWILTWFSHNFSSVKTICRIWDYLLCTGPFGIFYLTAGIILSTKQDLLQFCQQIDQPSIQTFYQEQSKKSSIDIQLAIRTALSLQQKYYVPSLTGYKKLQSTSMIRLQNFQKQIDHHKKYAEEKRRKQRRQKNIKNVFRVGAAVVLVITAVYFFKTYNRVRIGEL